ncbi:FAD-dependent oxidoreductase [Arundinibacter roseus]|uniref:FAD-dependent oxidoreductase n=1 Tax=Arundinibacter roseus TaxID=2070510 RepID=A0A4R4K4F8_9BACT|nr:FAD-dependent oxidoreductase [Arundinibacter roseus]TDB62324.1 FAD-dependent oxidoreductase [Arundinibacter roseus]
MKKLPILLLLLLAICLPSQRTEALPPQTADVVIYGGTAAGVMAAYTAKKMGKLVLLIEPTTHLGGLTSGGLGYTDIGNKYAITGLSRDFYRRIGQHYGKFEQWTFEPKVAKQYLQQYLDEAGIKVLYSHRVIAAQIKNKRITSIVLENSISPQTSTNQTVAGKMFIDATYEGDLMARAGVSYAVGREANSDYNETINGVQLMNGHQFPDGVDPYKIPGKPESGLLWGISPEKLAANGSGDKKVQAYNYRICLSSDPANQIPITRPEGYDPTRYDLLVRLFEKQPAKQRLSDYFIWSRMPNQKTDINNRGGFSTDMIGMNYDYPEANYAERARIVKEHELYTKGLLYFFGHDPQVPKLMQEEMLKWGYPKDEYVENNHWSPQLYVREVRRMIGSYVMTQANCQGKEVVQDGVGMAAYTMDSHNIQRVVVDGQVKNEGNVEVGGFGPYPTSYRSLIPKASECENLLVPVCLSATHIAYGSIRMEPVFMVLAQSAAVAACLALDGKTSVQQVDVKKLQTELTNNPLANGSTPELLVDNENKTQVSVKGNWTTTTKGSYGPTALVSGAPNGEEQSVRFTPEISKPGMYKAYIYFPKIPGLSAISSVSIHDGTQTRTLAIKESEIVVEGQTSGEWFPLGEYTLSKGQKAFVEISTKNSNGVVIADAVLFVPHHKP